MAAPIAIETAQLSAWLDTVEQMTDADIAALTVVHGSIAGWYLNSLRQQRRDAKHLVYAKEIRERKS